MRFFTTAVCTMLLGGALTITSPAVAAEIAPRLIVTTIAGRADVHGFGGDNGPARDALLHFPNALAADAAGNLYIADGANCRVRKIAAATGIITTVAGTGICSDTGDGGPASAASLSYVLGVAVDHDGNLYLGGWGYRVRKITAGTNIITTIAGTGVEGFSGDGGPATAAQLSEPSNLAVDSSGNVYIGGLSSNRVRRVDAVTGIITTVAGNGVPGPYGPSADEGFLATAVRMSPSALALDASGNLYIGDFWSQRVRRVDAATGRIHTVAGNGRPYTSGDGAAAATAPLWSVSDVAIDPAGNLIIAEGFRVRRVSAATGVITTIAGRLDSGHSGDGGDALEAQIAITGGMALDAAGNIYLSQTDSTIRRLSPGSHDAPLAGDLDGDGASDLVVWRPSTGTWFWLLSTTGYDYAAARSVQWGSQELGDVPFLGDLDGDRKADLIVWRESTGTWYWLLSTTGYSHAAAGAKQWGNADLGDVPLVADLDGDRRSDLIVWRRSTGTWYWLTSSSAYDYARGNARQWGSTYLNDVPLCADVDGDGKGDLVVWRAGTAPATWMWSTSSSGYTDAKGKGFGLYVFGDRPFLTDIDGDGLPDFLLYRRQTATWVWLTAAGGYNLDAVSQRPWGSQALLDRPVPADFDADGRTDFAVWRASTGTWFWLRSTDSSAHQKQWGG